MNTPRVIAGGMLLASLFALPACASTPTPSPSTAGDVRVLVRHPGVGGTISLAGTEPGTAYTIADLQLCLDRPGQAVIAAVDPQDAYGGVTVQSFAVAPSGPHPATPDLPGGYASRSMDQLGLAPSGPVVLDQNCADRAGNPAVLVVQLNKASRTSAGFTGLRIDYTAGGASYTTTASWGAVLCDAADHTNEACP